MKIPFYAQHSVTTYTPEFDPYDLDIPLKEKLDATPSSNEIRLSNKHRILARLAPSTSAM